MTVKEVIEKLNKFINENPKATKAQLLEMIKEISEDLDKIKPEEVAKKQDTKKKTSTSSIGWF